VADLSIIVHENAHQWFGDSVTVKSWADICLNECFVASYAQWLWAEAKDGSDLDDRYRRAVEMTSKSTDFWAPKLTGMARDTSSKAFTTRASWPCTRCAAGSATRVLSHAAGCRPSTRRQRSVGGVRALRHQPVRAEPQRVLRRLVRNTRSRPTSTSTPDACAADGGLGDVERGEGDLSNIQREESPFSVSLFWSHGSREDQRYRGPRGAGPELEKRFAARLARWTPSPASSGSSY